MIHYLSWRVDSGRNKSITLNFLLTGHTKFSPDRSFGLIKLEYARSNVDCFEDFKTVVMRSSHRKFNVAVDGGEVEWRQWDAHFGDFYKTLKGEFLQLLFIFTKFQFHYSSSLYFVHRNYKISSLPLP